MIAQGYEAPPALLPETPYVLHALAEGPVGNPIETNPGMIRGKDFEGDGLPASDRTVPSHRECRRLVDEMLRVAVDPASPAVARAGWILFTLGEIHPFQDGNGRVARLLYLLVAGEAMPRTIDWGVLEQLRFHESHLVACMCSDSAVPTVRAATELSVAGAQLMAERLAVLGAIAPELARRLGLTMDAALIVLAVWLRRVGPVCDVAHDLAFPFAEVSASARALEAHGLLERHVGVRPAPSSGSAYADPDPVAYAYTTVPGVAAEISLLVSAAGG